MAGLVAGVIQYLDAGLRRHDEICYSVIPAKAGIQELYNGCSRVFDDMTG